MNIRGKAALITGAAGGIGRAVARELAEHGISMMALVDQSPQVVKFAEELTEEFGNGLHAIGYSGDVCDPGFRGRVYAEMRTRQAVVRICVPAAGITRDELAVKFDKEKNVATVYPMANFRLVTEINLIAPVYWALEMVAGIAEIRKSEGRGRWTASEEVEGAAIFVGSVSAQGNKGQIAYAAAKAGLEGASATLMMEAIYYGVRSAIVHPGYTKTPMVQALGNDFVRERILPQTQLRRLIEPEEIARTIAWMIGSDVISGPVFADAGWHPAA